MICHSISLCCSIFCINFQLYALVSDYDITSAAEILRVSGKLSNQGFGDFDRLQHRSPSPMASSNHMSNVSATGIGAWNSLQQEVTAFKLLINSCIINLICSSFCYICMFRCTFLFLKFRHLSKRWIVTWIFNLWCIVLIACIQLPQQPSLIPTEYLIDELLRVV